MRQAGRSLPEYRAARVGTAMLEACLDPALASEITLQPVRRHDVDAAIFFSDIVVPLQARGRRRGDQARRRPRDGLRGPHRRRRRPAARPRPADARGAAAGLGRGRAHGGRARRDAPDRLRGRPLHARRVPGGGRPVARPPGRPHPHARRPGHVDGADAVGGGRDGCVPARAGAGRCQRDAALRLVGGLAEPGGLHRARRPRVGPGADARRRPGREEGALRHRHQRAARGHARRRRGRRRRRLPAAAGRGEPPARRHHAAAGQHRPGAAGRARGRCSRRTSATSSRAARSPPGTW